MSKLSSSERVLVDIGTDSPTAELSPPISISAPIDPQCAAVTPPAASTSPFNWADEPDAPHVPEPLPRQTLPPCGFSGLRSDSTSLPFVQFLTIGS